MFRVFSGALQFALGMMLFRGFLVLMKRIVPLATSALGFLWGMGYDPIGHIVHYWKVTVSYVNYVLAWGEYLYAWAQYYTLSAHYFLYNTFQISPFYIYGAIAVALIILRATLMNRETHTAAPMNVRSNEGRGVSDSTTRKLEFADYFQVGKNDLDSKVNCPLEAWLANGKQPVH